VAPACDLFKAGSAARFGVKRAFDTVKHRAVLPLASNEMRTVLLALVGHRPIDYAPRAVVWGMVWTGVGPLVSEPASRGARARIHAWAWPDNMRCDHGA
jgi:hypothetical protein